MQQADTPTALYQYPRNTFVAGFIGTPPMNLIEGEFMGEGSRFRSASVGFELELGPSWAGALRHPGRRVILGVRPEDLRIVLPGQNVDPRSVISARVEMVELLGGEALVHCSGGGAEPTARSPAPFSTEGAVGLEVPPERVHLFDGESRERLNL